VTSSCLSDRTPLNRRKPPNSVEKTTVKYRENTQCSHTYGENQSSPASGPSLKRDDLCPGTMRQSYAIRDDVDRRWTTEPHPGIMHLLRLEEQDCAVAEVKVDEVLRL
jgi:hypothetical protein